MRNEVVDLTVHESGPASPKSRSEQLDLSVYDTDKITNQYLRKYDPLLLPWVDQPIQLLELGVYHGGSVQLWRDYFSRGTITGVDIKLPEGFEPGERVRLFEGSQADRKFLSQVAGTVAPAGFDIIIDDASHIGELTRRAFWHLFDNYLKPGGLYVIEDWGTGYWDDWRDGKALKQPALRSRLLGRLPPRVSARINIPASAHSYGMVGFIKELVDEQCAADVTRGLTTGTAQRGSRFESVLVTPSIVFVKKSNR